jgi:adenylate kinase
MLRIILLGPPGSGKGTASEQLVEKFGVTQVATGDIFRENIKNGTALGRKAKEYMDKGELVPDELVTDLAWSRLSEFSEDGTGYILDGFPRTLTQAHALDSLLAKSGGQIDHVIYFKVDDETLIARISGRRVCPACGKVYHVTNMPPAKDGVCGVCGGSLIQREDDNEETARNRISVYKEQTAPLIGYYKGAGILAEVNGAKDKDEVFVDIKKLLEAGAAH